MLCDQFTLSPNRNAERSTSEFDWQDESVKESYGNYHKTDFANLSEIIALRTQSDPSGALLIRSIRAIVEVSYVAPSYHRSYVERHFTACFRGRSTGACNHRS